MIPTTTSTSTSTMMNVLYSSTSFLLLLLIGLLIVNFNISIISSGFCQDLIRRCNFSEDDDDEDEEGYGHNELEPQQGESRPLLSSSSTFSPAQSRSTSRPPQEPLHRQRLSSDRRSNSSSTDNISQRIRSTSSQQQQQQQHDGEGDGNGDNGRHHQSTTHAQSTTAAITTTRRDQELEETYEIIYRNISRRYLEGEDVKSWMWLMGALLINVVCIRVELLLFDSLTSLEYVDGSTTFNTTNVTNVTTMHKPIYSNISNIITNISASASSNTTENESYPVF